MRRWLAPLLALSLFACAGVADPANGRDQALTEDEENPTEPAPGGDLLTYAEAAPIIASACGGCHADRFDTLAKVKAKKDRMKLLIERGQMPRAQPTWRDSEAGKSILKFLAESPELR